LFIGGSFVLEGSSGLADGFARLFYGVNRIARLQTGIITVTGTIVK
jgi:hypothetical protein